MEASSVWDTVRENAVNVLGEMEAKAAGELPKLKKLLHHESLMMRTAAEQAVERIEKASARAKDKG